MLRQMMPTTPAKTICVADQKMRKAMPGMTLSTDIIVGFPGETEPISAHAFADRRSPLRLGFIFKYSPREGTPAASLDVCRRS